MALNEEDKKEVIQRKSSKKRTRLKGIIIALVVVLVLGLGFLAYEVFFANQDTEADTTSDIQVTEDVVDGSSSAMTLTEVPALSDLFGKTVNEALELLPAGSTVKSTSESTDDRVAAVKQVTVISIPADEEAEDGAEVPTAADLYLSLDENGKVCKVYYQVPLANLGNTDVSFSSLLANREFIETVLQAAGVDIQGLGLVSPTEKDYQTFDETDASKLKSEAFTFTGDTGSNKAPKNWELKFAFDYAQVNITGNPADLTRMMYLTLY